MNFHLGQKGGYRYFNRVVLFFFSARFKNVMFDIKSGDEIGVFEVSAKFMGVAMEKVELVFQVRKYWLERIQ